LIDKLSREDITSNIKNYYQSDHRSVSIDQGNPYSKESKLLSDFFNKFKENTDESIVAAKVSMLDALYNTQMSRRKGRILAMTEIIISKEIDFDNRVQYYNPNLVEDILHKLPYNNWVKSDDPNEFSFVSKYVTIHNYYVYNQNDYAIFDSLVQENLDKLYIPLGLETEIDKRKGKYKTYWHYLEHLKNNKNYAEFREEIGHILELYNLNGMYRELDWFLWEQAKNMSSPTYSNSYEK
jgi:hypothetical protein